MVPDLLAAIAATPNIGLTSYLVNDYGQPFTVAGQGRATICASGATRQSYRNARRMACEKPLPGTWSRSKLRSSDEGGGWLERARGSCNLRGGCSPGIACPSSDRQVRQPIFGRARVTTLPNRLAYRLSNPSRIAHLRHSSDRLVTPTGGVHPAGKHVFLRFSWVACPSVCTHGLYPRA